MASTLQSACVCFVFGTLRRLENSTRQVSLKTNGNGKKWEVFFANWAPACRVLVENISEWYSLLGEIGLAERFKVPFSGLMTHVSKAHRSTPNPADSAGVSNWKPIMSRRHPRPAVQSSGFSSSSTDAASASPLSMHLA